MQKLMKAMVIREFGGPEVFELQEIPVPEIKPGHVLVKVEASSVNPVDTKIRKGLLAAIAPEAPTVLGCDLAGSVVAVGDGVLDFQIGDAIFACAAGVKGCGGALAEFALCDARLCAPKPATLDWAAAAALPLVSITAWEALFDRGQLKPGQRALIHAGTGGVGHIATQLAVSAGARVFATVSTQEKADIVRKWEAEPIFYKEKSVTEYVNACTGGTGFEFVLDTVGGENVATSFAAAAVSGTVVSISTRTTADLSPLHAKGLSLHVVFMLIPMLYNRGNERSRQGEILRELAALVDAGKVAPLLDSEKFSFTQAAAAHARLESGQAIGKVVLHGW
jgi:NADPH2:quinone reductase